MESKLRIFCSNRLESLVDRLAEEIAADPLDPLEREVVVVQSRGMYRWVTLELARRLGVAATLATPFPGTFCRALAERVGGLEAAPSERYEPAGRSSFDRDALTWRLFALLTGTPQGTGETLAAYLTDDPDQRKRYQLALRLAGIFDDYQLYRPELLERWEAGHQPVDAGRPWHETAQWQARLWRELTAGASERSLAHRLRQLTAALHAASQPPAGLPPRLSVFGAASLPPIFVELLAALARFVPVGIYFVSPTYHYWGDLRSEREAARIRRRVQTHAVPAEALALDQANELLAALGRQGREFFNLLQRADTDGSAWYELDFPEPDSVSVLSRIQSDILHLVRRGADAAPLPVPERDRSLQVHICHSRMREMEALRDAILQAFAEDAALRPHDVFVLVTDVDAYAPYIDAVFGVEREGEATLPYSIADRHPRAELAALDAALRLIEMIGTRLTAPAVLELLDTAAVRRAAGIEDHELAAVRTWIERLNVRWAADADHRAALLGIDAGGANTWRSGLDRLLMGYATGPVDGLVAGILPHASSAPGDATLVGRLAAFVSELLSCLRALEQPRTADRWANDVSAALTALLEPEGETEERSVQLVRDGLMGLADLCAAGRVAESIDVEVLREHLRGCLAQESGAGGFITGAITFCRFEPMRTLPAKIVCVAGLNEEEFPRRDRPLTFNLMGQERRPGDPSLRDADRWLFLETVLAARQHLLLSYAGRSQKDNSPLAPSSVLSELLDQIDRSFVSFDGQPASRSLVVGHRLQPFSEVYFGGHAEGRVAPDKAEKAAACHPSYSYSQENCAAALAARGATAGEKAFFTAPLNPDVGPLDITLADLIEFWTNPCKYFCTRVIGLQLPRDKAELADTEPFLLDGRERYGLLDRLIARRLDGRQAGPDELALLQAAGVLPLAGLARSVYAELVGDVAAFIGRIHLAEPREHRDVMLTGDGWRLAGSLEGLTIRGQIRHRPAKLKSTDRLQAWIRHVALNAAVEAGAVTAPSRTTLVIAKDKAMTLRPLQGDHSLRVLTGLVDGYREGRSRPLPVFEQASFLFAECANGKSKSKRSPIDRARAEGWEVPNQAHKHGARRDSEDAYVRLCMRGREPLDEEFEVRAHALWKPYLEAEEQA